MRVRITDLRGIDLSLFDFDRHNALYYFILNSKEYIYLRYGGRDTASATTYLNIDSFDLALQQGLDRHRLYLTGELPKQIPKSPLWPTDILSLNQNVIQKNNCVECHLISDYQAIDSEKSGSLRKELDMYRSPEIKKLGIELNIPKGLEIKDATGAASKLQAGDIITGINHQAVLTFADLQYYLDQVDRDAKEITLQVKREEKIITTHLTPPSEWWVSDLAHRRWSIDPQLYFKSKPLSAPERKKLNLPTHGFSSKVISTDVENILNEAHQLEIGDIITEVNQVTQDPLTKNVAIHIKLRHRAGEGVSLKVLRNEKPLTVSLKTGRLSFRK